MEPDFKLITFCDDMDSLQRQINDYEKRLQRAERLLNQAEKYGKETAPLINQIELYRYLKAEAEQIWDKKSGQARSLRLEIKRAARAEVR